MAESPSRPDSANRFQPLFYTLRLADAHERHVSDSDDLVKALAWCIAAVKHTEDPQIDAGRFVNPTQQDKMHVKPTLRLLCVH